MISQPKLEDRQEQPYMGIRLQFPSKNLSTISAKLLKELTKWLGKQGIKATGPAFQRFYVIAMGDEFDLEVGIPVAGVIAGDDRVKPGVIPAGRYANLTYLGRNNAYKGNKTLVEWAKANGIPWDRWDDPKGDAFRCRYETYLTDRMAEADNKKWQTNVAIKIAN